MKTLIDGVAWVVVEPKARSLKWPLADYWNEKTQIRETVGTYYGSLFLTYRAAKDAAVRWKGSRVVKVRISQEKRGPA